MEETTTIPSTKKCPFCAEDIRAEARKCRFCGERLDAPRTSARRILAMIGPALLLFGAMMRMTHPPVPDALVSFYEFFFSRFIHMGVGSDHVLALLAVGAVYLSFRRKYKFLWTAVAFAVFKLVVAMLFIGETGHTGNALYFAPRAARPAIFAAPGFGIVLLGVILSCVGATAKDAVRTPRWLMLCGVGFFVITVVPFLIQLSWGI